MNQLTLSLMPGIDLLGMAFQEAGFCVVRGGDPIFGGDVRGEHYPPGKFEGIISGPPCQSFSSLVHLVRANGHEPRFGNLIPEFERCVSEARPEWFLMENVPQAPEPVVAGYGSKAFLIDNSALAGEGGFGLEQRRVRRFTFGMRGRADVPNLLRWVDMATFLLPDTAASNMPFGKNETPSQRDRGVRRTAVNAGHDDPNISLTLALRERKRRTVIGDGTLTTGAELVRNGERTKDPERTSRRCRFADACRLQGLPEDFLSDAPFTVEGKLKAVANGVPLPMGRAIAKAIKEALRA